jgi:DNA mismatch repair ATPase MutS
LLVDLDDPFNDQSVHSIRTLRKLLDFINSRSNLFYGLFDLLLLLDVYLVNGFYKWKRENRKDLSRWFGNIADIEVLGSLALYSFANPEYSFPELTSGSQQWEAQGLGHPLIPDAERVTNNFSVEKDSPLAIITGSNMSGKSTFLRTVGINSILAYAGAPVAAHTMRLGMFRIFTAMRTEDDLSSHISSFYAELKRIKALLDSLDQHPTLCLLDEILKGTNTEDRHRGAKGLLIQLSETNTAGLVSTHDLALGKWGQAHGFANFSFNSTISNDQIHFDYHISSGICHSFNASQLMKNMGIRLPADGDDPGAT